MSRRAKSTPESSARAGMWTPPRFAFEAIWDIGTGLWDAGTGLGLGSDLLQELLVCVLHGNKVLISKAANAKGI
jgi:hypothetical protein